MVEAIPGLRRAPPEVVLAHAAQDFAVDVKETPTVVPVVVLSTGPSNPSLNIVETPHHGICEGIFQE